MTACFTSKKSMKRHKGFVTLCLVGVNAITIAVACRRFLTKSLKRTQERFYRRPAIMKSLRNMATTPWRQILSCGSNMDFIVSINFTREVLLNDVLHLFDTKRIQLNYGSPYRKSEKYNGAKHQLESINVIGLCLWYLKSGDPMYKLCPIFGIVPSTVRAWLEYGLEVLLSVVRDQKNTQFAIAWPKYSEMVQSAALLQQDRQNGRTLGGVFGIMGGERMPCGTYTDPYVQNAYWEGFTQADEVTNLFVWNFRGELIHAGISYPGSWDDLKVATASLQQCH